MLFLELVARGGGDVMDIHLIQYKKTSQTCIKHPM